MQGRVTWFEVMGQNADTLRAFYGELFGWSLSFDNEMKYSRLNQEPRSSEDGIPGGVGLAPQGKGWATFYISVNDIEASAKRVSSLKGDILMPVTEIPDGTKFCVVSDPEGHVVGLVQSAA